MPSTNSNPLPTPNAEKFPDASPSPEHIRAWLLQHPDFFKNHPDLLPQAITASGRVLSLEASQLNRLQQQNENLREKLDLILERIRRNDIIHSSFHAIQIQMLLAQDISELFKAILHETQHVFDIDRVTLSILQDCTPLKSFVEQHQNHESFQDRLFLISKEVFSRAFHHGHKPMVRIGREGQDRELFFGLAQNQIRSETLVPLFFRKKIDENSNPLLAGSLNLGAKSPNRFLPSDATDLLEDLADVLVLCLERLL